MKLMAILLIVTGALADSFLGNMYIDLKDLDLTPTQQYQLKDIMKKQHEFLKQWYEKARNNNEKIIQSFSHSSLNKHSRDLSDNISLVNERLMAEQDFLISLYGILNESQRARLGNKIKNDDMDRQVFGKGDAKIESNNIYVEKHEFILNGRQFRHVDISK